MPLHVKSYLRRATARNALGRHRAAVSDLRQVLSIQPKHKQATVELRKTLELRKSAIRKAPRQYIDVEIVE